MRKTYRIVHRLRNGEEREIAAVDTWLQVEYIVEDSRYLGTWLDKKRKLLRYGRGQVLIEEIEHPMTIVHREVHEQAGKEVCMLEIANSDTYGWVVLTEDEITILDKQLAKPLLIVKNFAELAVKLNKEIAFECFEHYERFIEEYNLVGSL